MRYRVVFRERVSGREGALENPVAFLQADRSDEIVRQGSGTLRAPSARSDSSIAGAESAATRTARGGVTIPRLSVSTATRTV